MNSVIQVKILLQAKNPASTRVLCLRSSVYIESIYGRIRRLFLRSLQVSRFEAYFDQLNGFKHLRGKKTNCGFWQLRLNNVNELFFLITQQLEESDHAI